MNQHHASLEDPFQRDAALGYDPPSDIAGLLRCVSHGTPSPLIRWHYHEDYELHLVIATSGKFFVGDFIGNFEPGNLVLTGPRLPHNWITTDAPPEGVPLRDHCIVFNRGPIEQAIQLMPELREVLPLLDRAVHGIEFFGLENISREYFERIVANRNTSRLGIFFDLLGVLSRSSDYRLLSGALLQGLEDEKVMDQTNKVLSFISEHYTEPLRMTDVAKRFHMSESNFSRNFQRCTGNSFTDFLIRVRVTRACQLLMQTDNNIATICGDVGFNNVANFNRRFLSVKGLTPSAFRQQTRGRFG